MGCCGSSEEVEITGFDAPGVATEDVIAQIEGEEEAELDDCENKSLVSSILKAREAAPDDAGVLEECCTKLGAYNAQVKNYIAVLDANTAHEAMKGGLIGLGCNDKTLIATLCTRTKPQLARTEAKYRELFDADIRSEVKGETGGDYGRLMYFAMGTREEYIADMIDVACTAGIWEFGCNETLLVQVFVTHTQEELQAGRELWEGRTDKSLIDYINDELDFSYRHLQALIFHLLKGERDPPDAEVDEGKAAEQVATLHEEIEKGWFEDFEETVIIDILSGNSQSQNAAVATLYEDEFDESLGKALDGKCGEKLHLCLTALILPWEDFICSQLKKAMDGWGTEEAVLIRLLSGLDGDKMTAVAEAYERKYGLPLAAALKEEISGDFLRAALAWVGVMLNPLRSLEDKTSVEPAELEGDAEALGSLLDSLLLEMNQLVGFASALDTERLAEACEGWGTDDTALITVLATRSKRYIRRIALQYRATYGKDLNKLIKDETSGWYKYLLQFIVLPPAHSDLRLLDLAMDGLGTTEEALIEFLVGRSPARVKAAKEAWEGRHDASLVDRFNDELSGEFQYTVLQLLKFKRRAAEGKPYDGPEGSPEELAAVLHEAASGDDHKAAEKLFVQVLALKSGEEVDAIEAAYEDENDSSLRRLITKTFDGCAKNALLALLMPPDEWYASRLKDFFDGMGTLDKGVCRVLGCNDKAEVRAIAKAYEKKYGTPLKAAIASECSGDYKKLLIAWISLPDLLEQPEGSVEIPDEPEPPEPEPEPEPEEEEEEEEGRPPPVANPGYRPFYETPFVMTKGGPEFACFKVGVTWDEARGENPNTTWVKSMADATQFLVTTDAAGVECFVTVEEHEGRSPDATILEGCPCRRWVYSQQPERSFQLDYPFVEGETIVPAEINMARYYEPGMHREGDQMYADFMEEGCLGESDFTMQAYAEPAAEAPAGNPGYEPFWHTAFVLSKRGDMHGRDVEYACFQRGERHDNVWVESMADATRFLVTTDAAGVECFVTVEEHEGRNPDGTMDDCPCKRWVISKEPARMLKLEPFFVPFETLVEPEYNMARYYEPAMHEDGGEDYENFVGGGKLGGSNFHMEAYVEPEPESEPESEPEEEETVDGLVGPSPGFLSGYAQGGEKHDTLAAAAEAAFADDAAGGVTREELGVFTVRSGRKLKASPTDEMSWVKPEPESEPESED